MIVDEGELAVANLRAAYWKNCFEAHVISPLVGLGQNYAAEYVSHRRAAQWFKCALKSYGVKP
jgi:hypothetical protein